MEKANNKIDQAAVTLKNIQKRATDLNQKYPDVQK